MSYTFSVYPTFPTASFSKLCSRTEVYPVSLLGLACSVQSLVRRTASYVSKGVDSMLCWHGYDKLQQFIFDPRE